jgi:hypothetical protein
MNRQHLIEHDANQGAQSSGEFLGMSGNSAWYLLGAVGATIMIVVFFWGVFGASLLFCLLVGLVLCLGAVTYVFALKNNRPAHYDTDYFEAALIEAGVLAFRFGPRVRRPINPFASLARGHASDPVPVAPTKSRGADTGGRSRRSGKIATCANPSTAEMTVASDGKRAGGRQTDEQTVARSEYDRLQDKLAQTEETLEDVLADVGED